MGLTVNWTTPDRDSLWGIVRGALVDTLLAIPLAAGLVLVLLLIGELLC